MSPSHTLTLDLNDLLARTFGAPLSQAERQAVLEMRDQAIEWVLKLEAEISLDEFYQKDRQNFLSIRRVPGMTAASLASESDAMRKKIQKAETELYLMQKRRRCCKSLLVGPSFIGRLSSETLQEIFSYCTDIHMHFHWPSVQYFNHQSENERLAIEATGLALRQVCSLWRDIMTSSPKLWSRISFTDDPNTISNTSPLCSRSSSNACSVPKGITLLSSIVELSQNNGLDINIRFGGFLPWCVRRGSVQDFVHKLVLLTSHRWRRACVQVANISDDFIRHRHRQFDFPTNSSPWFLGRMPLLKSLDFSREIVAREEHLYSPNANFHHDRISYRRTSQQARGPAGGPNLRTMVLRSCHYLDLKVPLTGVKRIEIYGDTHLPNNCFMPVAEFCTLVRSAIHLEHLVVRQMMLRWIDVPASQPDYTPITSHLTALTLPNYASYTHLEDIYFPNLTQLVVPDLDRNPSLIDIMPLSKFLTRVRLTLASLSLEYAAADPGIHHVAAEGRPFPVQTGSHLLLLVIALNKVLGHCQNAYIGIGDVLPTLRHLKYDAETGTDVHGAPILAGYCLEIGNSTTGSVDVLPQSSALRDALREEGANVEFSDDDIKELLNREVVITTNLY